MTPAAARYLVRAIHPHDPHAFTQGLVYADGTLYESTGLNGRSDLRRVEIATGRVLQRRPLAPQHFGEGLTIWRDAIVQLTWLSGVAFVCDRDTFEPRRSVTWPREGWGLTHDGTRLITSDGSPLLRLLDPETFAERGRLLVTSQGGPVARLNDLQFARGALFANVWRSPHIVRIDPLSGEVTGWLDLTPLCGTRNLATQPDVPNGIAYDPDGDRLFVTGKLWPHLFELTLTDD